MADSTATPAPTASLRVWDPWIRIVHWSIVLLLPFSYWTATTSRFDWHFLSGYAILTLVIFRIAWGLVGSQTTPPAAGWWWRCCWRCSRRRRAGCSPMT